MELHKASVIRSMNDEFFMAFAKTDKCQVATMCLLPDQTSGEFGTHHPQSDQVLIVVEGRGKAKLEGGEHDLEPGDVLVIKAGEKHQILANTAESLRTLNVYSPVAYPED